MWAAIPVQQPPPGTRHLYATSSSKPLQLRRRIAAHRQDNQKLSGLGLAFVFSALNSNGPPPQPQKTAAVNAKHLPSPPPPKKEESDEEKQQPKPLTGADVLIALQRATAVKANKKKQKRDYLAAVSGDRINTGRKGRGTPDFVDARPLRIKPDWSDRLEELENRLKRLLDG